MIVLFAGAGASKAVANCNFPTTREFLDGLPSEVIQNALFGLINNWLLSKHGTDAPLDIEQVLWALYDMRDFFAKAAAPSALEGWLLRDPTLKAILGSPTPNINFVDLTNNAGRLVSFADALMDRINEEVYRLYAQEPADEDLRNNWLSLLKVLLKTGHLEVFTTNYDLVIEKAAAILSETEPELPRLDAGRIGNVKHSLNQQSWRQPPAGWDWSGAGGRLTKLHGSVDWSRGDDQIYVGDPTFKGTHKKHVILYPGFKNRPTEEPFVSFHNYFRDCIQVATAVIFIGFSFRDPAINDVVARWLPPTARVLVVNPDEHIPVPLAENRVERVLTRFEPDLVRTLFEVLGKQG